MEYPTIFTCGSRMFTAPELYTPESVTVHEAGHQFWYGLVGNKRARGRVAGRGVQLVQRLRDPVPRVRTAPPRRGTRALPVMGEAPSPLPGGGALANGIAMDDLRAPNPIRWILDEADVEISEGPRSARAEGAADQTAARRRDRWPTGVTCPA